MSGKETRPVFGLGWLANFFVIDRRVTAWPSTVISVQKNRNALRKKKEHILCRGKKSCVET